MQRYILKRLLAAIPTMAIVGVVVFSIIHLAPGDPAAIMAGEDADYEQVEAMRESMGLLDPIPVQFWRFVSGVAQGDLGESIFSGHKVSALILDRVEPTLSLAVLSLSISILVSIPAGVLAAWKMNSIFDRVVMILALTGYAVPYFALGYVVIFLLAVQVEWFPAGGYIYLSDDFWGYLHHLLLPSFVLGFAGSALITRMTRATMLEVLKEDYVRTARSKGLGETVVLLRHAFRNAANPVLTVIGFSIAGFISGVVITETVFAIPGMGRLITESIAQRDFQIIQSTILVVALIYVMVNLTIDILYVFVDPRIRYDS